MNVKGYLRALRDGWWLCLVGLLMGGLVSAVITSLATPMYVAETRMFISTTSGTTLSDAVQGSQFSQQRIASYQAYLTDQQVMSAVIRDLGLTTTPEALASQITVDNPAGTLLLNVAVTATSPSTAVAIAQSIDQQFPELVARLETPQGSTVSPVNVTITARPMLPDGPASPDPARQISIGLLLGLLLGALVALLRDRLDTRVRSTDQVASITSAPALGLVRSDQSLFDEKVLAKNSTSVSAEDFRRLRTNLDYVDVDSPPRVIVVSSPSAGEGKTTLAVNLAMTQAASGRRVVLVEADLRRPRVTRYLGLPAGAGLSQVLSGVVDLNDVLQPSRDENLSVLAAGPCPPNPGELLASEAMAGLVHRLREGNDLVIIDSAPLLPVADTGSLTSVMDGLILCAQWGKTNEAELRHAGQTVHRAGGRLLGVVLTRVPKSAVRDEGYGAEYLADSPVTRQRPWYSVRRPKAELDGHHQNPSVSEPTVVPPAGQHPTPVGAESPGQTSLGDSTVAGAAAGDATTPEIEEGARAGMSSEGESTTVSHSGTAPSSAEPGTRTADQALESAPTGDVASGFRPLTHVAFDATRATAVNEAARGKTRRTPTQASRDVQAPRRVGGFRGRRT